MKFVICIVLRSLSFIAMVDATYACLLHNWSSLHRSLSCNFTLIATTTKIAINCNDDMLNMHNNLTVTVFFLFVNHLPFKKNNFLFFFQPYKLTRNYQCRKASSHKRLLRWWKPLQLYPITVKISHVTKEILIQI